MDSHGSDIEHFRPKALFPQRMFRWRNLLLCCTECGRIKNTRFPCEGVSPLLIDPTKEEPWKNLDFDPATGNITATFDAVSSTYSRKGIETVRVLELDQREALAAGYIKTYKRLAAVLNSFLDEPTTTTELVSNLLEVDEHGLVGWFFKGKGCTELLSRRLRDEHPDCWRDCVQALIHF